MVSIFKLRHGFLSTSSMEAKFYIMVNAKLFVKIIGFLSIVNANWQASKLGAFFYGPPGIRPTNLLRGSHMSAKLSPGLQT